MPTHADARSVVRRRTALALGAGGAAVALAAAPAALAAGASPNGSAHPTPDNSTPQTVSSAPKVPAADVTTTTTAPAPIVGNFGTQKIRVGVDVDPGPYTIPAGVTTLGSQITIKETEQDGTDDSPAPCTTNDTDTTPGSSTTYCYASNADTYVVGAGDTAVITQSEVVNGLVIDSHSITVGPCLEPTDSARRAAKAADYPTCSNNTQDVILTDTVPVPKAVDDHATTQVGVPVTIPVLANDSSPDEAVTVTIASDPGHGTAVVQTPPQTGRRAAVVRAAGTTTLLYTPAAGYSGTDKFTYTITNRFTAPSTATVFVTIPAAATSTPPSSTTPSTSLSDSASVTSSPSATTPPIAQTGTPTGSLLGYGALLLAGGGALSFAGRRRIARGRHAR